jgi:hypothetical protein
MISSVRMMLSYLDMMWSVLSTIKANTLMITATVKLFCYSLNLISENRTQFIVITIST